jgi:KaiC/GvpD/RAD55 family RecA-like ATPase
MTVAAAQRVIFEDAKKIKDYVMVLHMRKRMREGSQMEKDAGTKVGVQLQEIAAARRDADAKRRQEARREDRLAAKNLEEVLALKAKREQATQEARVAFLKLSIVNRREAEARRRQCIVDRAFRRWLQTQYPSLIARRCIHAQKTLPPFAETPLGRIVNFLKSI